MTNSWARLRHLPFRLTRPPTPFVTHSEDISHPSPHSSHIGAESPGATRAGSLRPGPRVRAAQRGQPTPRHPAISPSRAKLDRSAPGPDELHQRHAAAPAERSPGGGWCGRPHPGRRERTPIERGVRPASEPPTPTTPARLAAPSAGQQPARRETHRDVGVSTNLNQRPSGAPTRRQSPSRGMPKLVCVPSRGTNRGQMGHPKGDGFEPIENNPRKSFDTASEPVQSLLADAPRSGWQSKSNAETYPTLKGSLP